MGKVEQINALENGYGIQYLIDSAYMILKNPIYVVDIDYNLLGYTDVPVDDRVWNDLISSGTFSQSILELLAQEGFIEDFTNADRSIRIYSNAMSHIRIADRFFDGAGNPAGMIVIYNSQVPFDTEDEATLEKLADKITDEIRNHMYFITLTMTFYEEKINMLLDGVITDPLLYNSIVQVLYHNFEDYLYVAVLDVAHEGIMEQVHVDRLAYFKSLLKTQYPLHKLSVYHGYIVMLMSSANQSIYASPFIHTYVDLFERNGLSMGISSSFENMYELRKYYDQALAALKEGFSGNTGQRIFIHQDGMS